MVSVACFRVRVSVIFHLMFVHDTFSAILVAECPPLWKLLPARLAICSQCILSIFNFYLFPFFFRAGQVWCRSRPIRVFGVLVAFLTNLNLLISK